MKKIFIFLFALMFLCSCNKRKEEDISTVESITINAEKSISAYLDEITDTMQYISLNLPDGVYIGNIDFIKSYAGYLFIYDQFQAKTITIVDQFGKFIGQLDRKGKGPGEYLDLEAFAFDSIKNELVIYDRWTNQLIFYSFPELKYLRRRKENRRTFINFESLDGGNWLTVSDTGDKEGVTYGIEIWDSNFNTLSRPSNIGKSVASIETSVPITFTRIDEELYYSYGNEYTTLYKVNSKEQIPKIRIGFGKNKIPARYWDMGVYEFEKCLTQGEPKAGWVQQLLFDNEMMTFWFFYKNPYLPTRYLAMYDWESKRTKVFSELKIRDTELKLRKPKGVTDNYYISEIYPEDIEGLDISKNKKLSQAIAKNKDRLSPVLLLFKLKKSFDAESF